MSETTPPPIGVAVGAVITNREGEILLLERSDEHSPHMWSIPGGRMEYAESPLAAIRREILEETGLSIVSVSFLGYLHLSLENGHWISLVFHAPSTVGAVRISEGEPFIRAEWCSMCELPPLDSVAGTTINHFRLGDWSPK